MWFIIWSRGFDVISISNFEIEISTLTFFHINLDFNSNMYSQPQDNITKKIEWLQHPQFFH